MCLGTKGPSQTDEDRYAFSILDTVLGGSMSSRLFQEVREKRGLAYAIYSYNGALKDCGLYVVYAGTGKENFRKVVDLTIEEFNKIKKNGITKEEMDRSKEHLKGSLVLGLESTFQPNELPGKVAILFRKDNNHRRDIPESRRADAG